MSRELWGTFSVRDHLAEHAFVSDVLLYDRLLIPTKPAEKDLKEWPAEWDHARLDRALGVLGDLALSIPWTDQLSEQWRSHYKAGEAQRAKIKKDLVEKAGFDMKNLQMFEFQNRLHATRMLLAERAEQADEKLFLHLRATAKARPGATLEAVAAYNSFDNFAAEVPVAPKDAKRNPSISPTAIFGWDFFLPDPEGQGEAADLKLLQRAVKLASEPDFIESRSRLYDWLADASEGISKGALTLDDARRDMESRIADYQKHMKRLGWKRWARRAIKVADAFAGGLGIVSEAAGKFAEGFLGIADIVGDEWHDKESIPQRTKVAAVFHDARRKFGWKPLAET